MNADKMFKRRVKLFLVIVIVAAVLSEVFDLPPLFLEVAVSLGVAQVFSGIAEIVVISLGGEVLEDIEIVVKGVSISGFTVATFIVVRILF